MLCVGLNTRHAAQEAVEIEKAAQAEWLVVVVHIEEGADGAVRIAKRRMHLFIADAFDGAAKQGDRVERKPVVGETGQPGLLAKCLGHGG